MGTPVSPAEILATVPGAAALVDRTGTVHAVGPRFASFTRREARDLVGRPLAGLLRQTPAAQRVLAALAGPRELSEPDPVEVLCDPGPSVAALGVVAPAGPPFADGLALFVLHPPARPVPDSEVVKASRLETIALLAAGVAHDFNNMLTAILGNITLARAELAEADPVHRRLAAAEAAAERARELTRQLLTFTRGGDPVRRPSVLGGIVRDAARAVLRESPAVEGEFDIPGALWPVDADPEQIAQVVRNLAINAVQAMPHGGRAIVRMENLDAETAPAEGLPPGRYVRLSIVDSGAGIAPEHRARVFDPLFTTRAHGIGLGLTAAQMIVQRHQGVISIDSEPGEGTIVSVFLPALDVAPATAPRSAPVARSRPRVLVMDDEALIREVIGLYLERQGYEAVLAREGAEAVDLYRVALETGTRFDAVIMDLTVLGGMGGAEAIRRLLALDPEVRGIVASGYANDPVMANYREFGFRAALPKPFRADELTAALADLLSASGHGESS